MRCVALAQAWVDDGGRAQVILGPGRSPAEDTLSEENLGIRHLEADPGSPDDAGETARIARGMGAEWLVLDGYHFDGEYQHLVKEAGLSLLLFDDLGGEGPFHADIVLNPNLYAGPSLYPGMKPPARLLAGPDYIPLRREFLPFRGRQPAFPATAGRVLITLGGADPGNLTSELIAAASKSGAEGTELVVVAGANNPHYPALEATAASDRRIRLVRDTRRMAELMASADAAITGGGVTCFELSLMGVPFAVVVLSENQGPVAESFASGGAAVNLGGREEASSAEGRARIRELLSSAGLRRRLSERGQALVDGEGAGRLVMVLRGEPLRLRRAREGDMKMLWEWANDPGVRSQAFSREQIPWEEHVAWFRKKHADPGCAQYIALDVKDHPVGQIRFDVTGGSAEVDVSIDRAARNRGLGTALIRAGVRRAVMDLRPDRIFARVKAGNASSIRSFTKAGFAVDGGEEVRGSRAVRLKWKGKTGGGGQG